MIPSWSLLFFCFQNPACKSSCERKELYGNSKY
nr:MAG TPA: PROTEIN G PROTEIN G OF BOVINE [Caudoviricetes sp.]